MVTQDNENIQSLLSRLVQEKLLDHYPKDKQSMNRIIQETIDEYNRLSQEELAGLSPNQVQKLLMSDYISKDSVVKLMPDIPYEHLRNHELLNNSKNFLKLLQQENGTKATSSGYLNRAFVKKAIDVMIFPKGYLESIYDMNKVINEMDVWNLHLVRVLLGVSGLIRKYKGKFIVSKKGKPFIDEKNAGKLLCELFLGFLRKFNHSYLDRRPETIATIYSFPFSLYFIHHQKNNWIDKNKFIKMLPPCALENELKEKLGEYYKGLPISLITSRIIYPLAMFGLIEKQYVPDPNLPKSTILAAIKSTRLFEEFIRFDF